MPQVRCEHNNPVYELARTFHDLDRAATVVGVVYLAALLLSRFSTTDIRLTDI
jgi:hypothetical protein